MLSASDVESLPEDDEESVPDLESALQSRIFREELLAEKINAPLNLSRSENGQSVSFGVEWEVPLPLEPNLDYQNPNISAAILAGLDQVYLALLNNATIERHEASVLPVSFGDAQQPLHDAYEVAVPVDKMADCLQGLLDLIESLSPEDGLRTGVSLRFVGEETGLLSASHDKPHIWVTIVDFIYYNQE